MLEKIEQKNILSKSSKIIPKFVNKTFFVYNGKTFIKLLITKQMLNYRVGEFVFTRKNFSFKKKKK